jgi:hypothetical protein
MTHTTLAHPRCLEVSTRIRDPNDAAATFDNITNSELLFRMGLVSFLIIFIVDVIVAWALHIVFRAVNRYVSLVGAWFRIVYTVFLGVAVIFLFLILELVSGAEFLNVFDQGQLEAQVVLAAEAFTVWLLARGGKASQQQQVGRDAAGVPS